MENIKELKQYKELLDSGIINEEEFNMKKKELLSIGEREVEVKQKSETKQKKEKKPIDPKKKKSIITSIIAVIVLVAIVFGVKAAINVSQTSKRNAAVIEHIEPIMTKYGITDYTVGDIDDGFNFFEVYAEGFENLTNGKAMEMLIALDSVTDLEDPCGGEKISFSTVNVYPGKNADYYYYRVSTAWVNMGKSNYTKAGIYSSYGMKCVYECKN